jgi:hypothetical protein
MLGIISEVVVTKQKFYSNERLLKNYMEIRDLSLKFNSCGTAVSASFISGDVNFLFHPARFDRLDLSLLETWLASLARFSEY